MSKFKIVDLKNFSIDANVLTELPLPLIEKHTILPIKKEDNILIIATDTPEDFELKSMLETESGKPVKFVFAEHVDIKAAILSRLKIKNICPAATPASVAEVQDFNNKIKGLINRRKATNQPVDTTPTLKPEKISEPKTESKTQNQTPPEPISEKAKKEYKNERAATKIAKEKAQELKVEVEEETKKQLEQPEALTIEDLLIRTEGTPAIEIDVYPNQ